jgi:hypothetical protein
MLTTQVAQRTKANTIIRYEMSVHTKFTNLLLDTGHYIYVAG